MSSLDFTKKYVNKDLDFWSKVLFSDESKFNIFGSVERKLVWRKRGEELLPKNLQTTVKHGGRRVLV